MTASAAASLDHSIKSPKNLSARVRWLRDFYFEGADRSWNNEFVSWTQPGRPGMSSLMR